MCRCRLGVLDDGRVVDDTAALVDAELAHREAARPATSAVCTGRSSIFCMFKVRKRRGCLNEMCRERGGFRTVRFVGKRPIGGTDSPFASCWRGGDDVDDAVDKSGR